jgi:hypothetical protein
MYVYYVKPPGRDWYEVVEHWWYEIWLTVETRAQQFEGWQLKRSETAMRLTFSH